MFIFSFVCVCFFFVCVEGCIVIAAEARRYQKSTTILAVMTEAHAVTSCSNRHGGASPRIRELMLKGDDKT